MERVSGTRSSVQLSAAGGLSPINMHIFEGIENGAWATPIVAATCATKLPHSYSHNQILEKMETS
jgi:hypothetical protein